MSTASERRAAERQAAADSLRSHFPYGSTVHTVYMHRSASGMTHHVKVLAIVGAEIRDVSFLVARLGIGKTTLQHPGVKVTGSGMDMAFSVVYDLCLTLHGDGDALIHRSV